MFAEQYDKIKALDDEIKTQAMVLLLTSFQISPPLGA
jgi:hypothetical protein